MGYGQQDRLKDILKKEPEDEEQPAATKEEEEVKRQQQKPAAAKEQQDNDDEWYDTVTKISARKKTHERIQGDQKFKQIQHKDDHDQYHITHYNEGKGDLFI